MRSHKMACCYNMQWTRFIIVIVAGLLNTFWNKFQWCLNQYITVLYKRNWLGYFVCQKMGVNLHLLQYVDIMLSRYSNINYMWLSRDYLYALHMFMLGFPIMFCYIWQANSPICTHGWTNFLDSISNDLLSNPHAPYAICNHRCILISFPNCDV